MRFLLPGTARQLVEDLVSLATLLAVIGVTVVVPALSH